MAMGGLFSDLFEFGRDLFGEARTEITNEISTRLRSRFGTSDYIPAQNHVVEVEFPRVISEFESGRLTVAEAISEIQEIADGFSAYAGEFGTRGRNGASEIQALAAQIVRDMRAGRTTASQVFGSSTAWVGDNPLLFAGILVGGAFLLSGRRR